MIEISGFSFGVAELVLLVGFVLMFFVQLFYQLLMATFTLSGKKKVKQTEYPSFSIIVPSRNYEENLKELIPTLLEQDYPDFEVVVIDDCSLDGTEWYLSELKLQYSKLKTSRIIQETDFPNALAITIGIRASSKEWLIFLNPLCRVSGKDWLKSFAGELHPKTEAAFGFVKYANTKGSMQKFVTAEYFPGPACKTKQDYIEMARGSARSSYHPVGTCKMGVDDMAVVGPDCRVRGLEALRICDSSIMPRVVSSNTNAPTIAMAEKAADLIRGNR